jgi:hypothetical protein
MVPLEKQVVSLDLARRLKELGVKQESLFFWAKTKLGKNSEWGWQLRLAVEDGFKGFASPKDLTEITGKNRDDAYSAFTVAELGEMLPWDIVISRNIDKQWHITFQANGLQEKDVYSVMSENTEADARAKMLIYLLENGLYRV